MSARRTTLGKVERERAKKNKAAAKREQRLSRTSGEATASPDDQDGRSAPREDHSTAEILALVEQLHQRYDAGLLDYEDFEAQKRDFLGRLRLD